MDIAIAWSDEREAAQPPTLAASFRSPGLELLADRLETPRRHRILELGAARRANVDFLGQYRTVVHVEDLYRTLVSLPEMHRGDDEDDARDLDAIVDRSLAFPRDAQLDVVLGWDVLDYMDEPTIRAVMSRVTASCKPGTLLFLLVSNRATIPSKPSHFTMIDRTHLAYMPLTDDVRANPRYSPRGLERMMPGFRLLHSFLLGDGMQDYLFSYS